MPIQERETTINDKHPDLVAVIDDTVKEVEVETPGGEKIQMIEISSIGFKYIGENTAGVVVEKNGKRGFIEPTSVDLSSN